MDTECSLSSMRQLVPETPTLIQLMKTLRAEWESWEQLKSDSYFVFPRFSDGSPDKHCSVNTANYTTLVLGHVFENSSWNHTEDKQLIHGSNKLIYRLCLYSIFSSAREVLGLVVFFFYLLYLFVAGLVWFQVRLQKNYLTNLDENFTKGVCWSNVQLIRFWCSKDKGQGQSKSQKYVFFWA